ncbi:MAG: beta-lactamase [Acidimicrobiales bacterium]|nr:beta-lactamase [Acidimicrobiales bacterium]
MPAASAESVSRALDGLFGTDAEATLGHTHAVLVVHRGRLVAERYGTWFVGELEALAGKQPGAIGPDDLHLSWSMAKSVLHAAVGVAVGDGLIDATDRAPVPAWDDPGDPRHAITWDDLLTMRPGLAWVEEYYEFAGDQLPDVVTMLYGDGQLDMAAFAAGFPLVERPGSPEAYAYSSGTSNIASAALQRVLGVDEKGMRAFLAERLFAPIGMASADPRFDDAGTFVASSFLYATGRDWARFGLLALRDGVWEGERLLPAGWIDHGRAPRSPDDVAVHGAHWWDWDDGHGTFGARGFEGQRIMCVPELDLVVVRLGKTHGDLQPALDAQLSALSDAFRRA